MAYTVFFRVNVVYFQFRHSCRCDTDDPVCSFEINLQLSILIPSIVYSIRGSNPVDDKAILNYGKKNDN